MTTSTLRRHIAASPMSPSVPRLRMEPTGARRTLLDGGWWPRSTDPVAELPGLVLAIDGLRGPVNRLVLSMHGWDSRPRRLWVADRVLRLGYFGSQPVSLITALCDNGDRVDLLVVAPGTEPGTADAAMLLAATTGNLVRAQHILARLGTLPRSGAGDTARGVWERDGGPLVVTAARLTGTLQRLASA
ncbi:DUF5994 family protein [Allorhizocola rhizosphaerae]|uniref:DUF5994 family protein n=1 Tax=Allorhizocola rhizosphaerae TaxID=1872709 RepID=UPI000E3CBCE6|nr:DUF5994 family protein [Allorhizocola rhizosphaerae]